MRTIAALSAVVVAAVLATVVGGCSGPAGAEPGTPGRSTLRLGFFANLTHAPALVGTGSGEFDRALGPSVDLEPVVFNAGPAAVEALFAGQVDAAFIGPNPAINAFAKSDGRAIRIVSGVTTGGASLVVRDGIDEPSDLHGARIATPQIGGTQDVALRAWLHSQGFAVDVHGGGDVTVLPQENSRTLQAFEQHQIDGAWVPEPWATMLADQRGATVLIDEADLWPNRRWPTTVLVVRTEYLDEHPELVERLLVGLIDAVDSIRSDSRLAREAVDDRIRKVTGKEMDGPVFDSAWAKLAFDTEPMTDELHVLATRAAHEGFLEPVDLDGIVDRRPLDAALERLGRERVHR